MFKNGKKRLTLLLVSLSLILVAGVGVTLALIIDSTRDVENVFQPSRVSCAVVEKINDSEETTGGTATTIDKVALKKDVQIKNTGDTTAYIRAAIIVNWKTTPEDGNLVWAMAPVEGTDYTLTLNLSADGWVKSTTDGYYYYSAPVVPGDLTGVLITSATQEVAGPEDPDGNQYYLSIEIVASAIQSTLATSAQGAWAAAVTTGSN